MPLILLPGVISNNPPFVYVPTRTNHSGCLGHSQGHIPYQGRHYICSFVIHVFFPMILTPNLWFGEKKDRQPRSMSENCSSPTTIRLFHLSLYLFLNKPSIQPSDPTCQVALISTSRITTTTKIIDNAEFHKFHKVVVRVPMSVWV